MAFDDSDKEWLQLLIENAALKAHQTHMTADHAPLEARIAKASKGSRNEARVLLAGAAALVTGWEWVKHQLGER